MLVLVQHRNNYHIKKLLTNLTLLDSMSDATTLNITTAYDLYDTHNIHIGQHAGLTY